MSRFTPQFDKKLAQDDQEAYAKFKAPPMSIAIHQQQIDLVEKYFAAKVDAYRGDIYGSTPLMYLCRSKFDGQKAMLKLFFDNEIRVTDVNDGGLSAVYFAERNENYELANLLFNVGIKQLTKGCQKEDWEISVILKDEKEAKEDAADKAKDDLPSSDEADEEFIKAVQDGNVDVVKSLLEKNNIKVINGRGGLTPLMIAAAAGGVEMVNLLVNFGARVAIYDEENHSAIYYASASGHSDIAKKLLNIAVKQMLQGCIKAQEWYKDLSLNSELLSAEDVDKFYTSADTAEEELDPAKVVFHVSPKQNPVPKSVSSIDKKETELSGR